MKAIYRIRFNPDYFKTMRARDRASVKKNLLARLTPVLALIMLAYIAYGFYIGAKWAGIVLISGMMGLGPVIRAPVVYWRTRKDLAANPWDCVIALGEEALTVSATVKGATSETIIQWSMQSRAVRNADGFVLFQGKVMRWLPDSALSEATIEEVADLLRRHVPSYEMLKGAA